LTILDLPQVPLMLSHHHSDRSEILSVTGYMDTFTVPTLQPALLATVERLDHPKAGLLTVDISGVRLIDHDGLQMLLRVREKITDQGRTLVIRLRPGSQPETVFRGSKLASLLNAAYEPAA